jgi:SagB-type dehydrogenase family enzyme
MPNSNTDAAWAYHDSTKHSEARLRATPHYLDWEIKPRPFKVYPDLAPIPLPRELPPSALPALSVIAKGGPESRAKNPDLPALARVLHFSAGITRRKVYSGGAEMYFRAAACTGALYHIDVYVICGDLPGLSAGVYHFGPHDFALVQLRAGDYRGIVFEAAGEEPSLCRAPVVLAFASTYWRNSWKYQARTYRHCFWDCGTLLANLLAVAAADALPAQVVCGFVDEPIEMLLGLDRQREGALALVALGHAAHPVPPPLPALARPSLATLPLSASEVQYPAIVRMHAASALTTPDEVQQWRAAAPFSAPPQPRSGRLFPLRPLPEPAQPEESLDSVILRRGSARRFAPLPIRFEPLSTLLSVAALPVPADFHGPLSDMYLIVNAVDGLPSGTYVYHRNDRALELLRAGIFRREAGYLGLGQDLPATASVDVFFLSNLHAVLARFGNRGYRVAQLDAAIAGGKLYLAAYALRLGATGLTFFDDDVTEFFSPHAAGKSVMFLIAIGRGKTALPDGSNVVAGL